MRAGRDLGGYCASDSRGSVPRYKDEHGDTNIHRALTHRQTRGGVSVFVIARIADTATRGENKAREYTEAAIYPVIRIAHRDARVCTTSSLASNARMMKLRSSGNNNKEKRTIARS